ncbi:MAG: serine/threonine-protein phosphatase [Clostridia bacterium]|nr:serine/threonine-protein phosphatase [Clostridia bacterium]
MWANEMQFGSSGTVRGAQASRNRLSVRLYADQDLGSRESQQDSVAASLPEYYEERGVLCVLCDGMGGLADGKAASQTAADAMISSFYETPPDEPMERVLLKGCAAAQRAVLALQEAPHDRGTTLVALLVRESRGTFLSVGDSRLYLYRGGGLIPLTRDQNKRRSVETLISLGKLPPEARTDRKIRALNQFIGLENLETVDRPSQSFPLIAGDRLLLMSDGVYEALEPREALRALSLPGEAAAMELIDQVRRKHLKRQDNGTVALVDCVAAGAGG